MGRPIVPTNLLTAAQSFDDAGNYVGRIQGRYGSYSTLTSNGTTLLPAETYLVTQASTDSIDQYAKHRSFWTGTTANGTTKVFQSQPAKMISGGGTIAGGAAQTTKLILL